MLRAKQEAWTIVLLGEAGVGKTALAARSYDPTIEDLYGREIQVNNKPCLVQIIDTAGDGESLHCFNHSHAASHRQGDAFVLVYAITSRTSFDKLEELRRSIARVKGGTPVLYLVANKLDLQVGGREVSKNEGESLGRRFGAQFLEASAKEDRIESILSKVVESLRELTECSPLPIARENEPVAECGCVVM
ncbi:hypothetical protein V5O48_012694 [Marasmius crinis-equi]|uniref:Uncharacterized protein n=1 Tax=Marasmius crinis-equi TaxID=585013 RepID=A0ABR3F2D8_9AGAR